MNVYVIYGSPLSGKTTYVKKHKGDNDLVYDFDKIMSALSFEPSHKHNSNLIDYVLEIRDLIIAKLKSEKNIDNVWIITTEVKWDLKKNLVGLNPLYKEIKISNYEAKKRLKENPGNRDTDLWNRLIDKYFTSKRGHSDFHNTVEWKRKRKVILKRDSYMCKECARYGKVVEANTVHHILPIEERPDLRLNNNNLVSLCEEHHEKMHNKFNGTLSKLGATWRDRTLRAFPELKTTDKQRN